MSRWLWIAALTSACSADDKASTADDGGETDADTDTDTDADTDTDTDADTTDTGSTPTGAASCVPDDISGSAYDEATGHYIPIFAMVTYTDADFGGRATRSYVPKKPIGLVLTLPGGKVQASGDGVKESAQPAWQPLLNELIQSEFAIGSTESDPDTDANDWDIVNRGRAANDDIDHILSWREELVATTALEESAPLVLVSFSGAGNFLQLLAEAAVDEGLDVRVAVIHNGATYNWDPDQTNVAAVWTTSANEWVSNDVVSEGGPGQAYDAYLDHIGAGYDGEYYDTPEVPWTALRMTRNSKYDATESQEVFDKLVELGIIDAAGARTFDIRDYGAEIQRFVQESGLEGPDRVSPELEIVWAVHRFHDAHVIEECEFVLRHF